jgi:hypothetical protein
MVYRGMIYQLVYKVRRCGKKGEKEGAGHTAWQPWQADKGAGQYARELSYKTL